MKQTTVVADFYTKYGMFYDKYYMKNEEYALEKYNSFKIGASSTSPYTKETIINENTKVYYWLETDKYYPSYYVLQGSIVYDMWSDENNWQNNQKIFDLLGIKYTVPNLKNVMQKIS